MVPCSATALLGAQKNPSGVATNSQDGSQRFRRAAATSLMSSRLRESSRALASERDIVRARLMALLMAGATVVVAGPGRSESWMAPRPGQIAAQSAIVPLSLLVGQLPDGADLIDYYKAARTVADVETANAKVKAELGRAQLVASDL